MTNMVNSGDVYGRAGDWLIGTAKRHPEALLVLAAGCALLMRNGGGSSQGPPVQSSNEGAASDGRWQGIAGAGEGIRSRIGSKGSRD